MSKSGRLWRELALTLYEAARSRDTRLLSTAARIGGSIADLEEGVIEDLDRGIVGISR